MGCYTDTTARLNFFSDVILTEIQRIFTEPQRLSLIQILSEHTYLEALSLTLNS